MLVIDDEVAAATGLRALLRLDGYEVVASSEPRRALESLSREHFDVVITDLEMPDVHGVEVVRAARAASSDTTVFVVTAYTGSPAIDAALAVGARAVFAKPLDYDALAAAMTKALGTDDDRHGELS